MKRRFFNLLAALSLLLCAATVALWVRSYHVTDGLRWSTVSSDYFIASDIGFFTLTHRSSRFGAPLRGVRFPLQYVTYEPGSTVWLDYSNWNFLGIRSIEFGDRFREDVRFKTLNIPMWLFMAAAAMVAMPYLVMRSSWWARRRRHSQGLCPECGYDLRATPDRCPECGTIPAPPVSPSHDHPLAESPSR